MKLIFNIIKVLFIIVLAYDLLKLALFIKDEEIVTVDNWYSYGWGFSLSLGVFTCILLKVFESILLAVKISWLDYLIIIFIISRFIVSYYFVKF